MGFLNHNKEIAAKQEQARQKRAAAENEVKEKLEKNPLLDALMKSLAHEPAWVRTAQSYYDDRERIVEVDQDSFSITWCTYHTKTYTDELGKKQVVDVPDIHGQVAYSYTKSGYVPLHGFSYDDGRNEVSTSQVLNFWAMAIRERMAAEMPECNFGDLDIPFSESKFTYKVPKLKFKDWF